VCVCVVCEKKTQDSWSLKHLFTSTITTATTKSHISSAILVIIVVLHSYLDFYLQRVELLTMIVVVAVLLIFL
jgi:hypothetical protein